MRRRIFAIARGGLQRRRRTPGGKCLPQWRHQPLDLLRALHSVPLTAFVREFGKKAFRRPLDNEEVHRYVALFAKEPDFLKGAQLVVEALLQSPNFLFRLDATPNPALRPYATASRLSYAIWDTMPDDAT